MRTPLCFCVYKNTKKQRRESALPFSASPYCSTSLIMPPPMPQTEFWDVPFHHLGYPILPFGMSHFTIWDVPFYHLGYPILPFGVSHFTIWGIPFYHLGYPISPFGMSHFAFWGIPFHLLGYIFGTFAHNIQPDERICLLRFFAAKYMRFLCQFEKLI